MDAKLGREVLDFVTSHREQFNMSVFGDTSLCGTVACLAGHAMLLRGYSLGKYGEYGPEFLRPDGTGVSDPAREACDLLDLTEDEYSGDADDVATLFGPQPENDAIERFRALVEAAEAVSANG